MAETIGSLVDKITIMDLKAYHMQEQVDRPDASGDHKKACQEKARVLTLQRNDLAQELSELFDAVVSGRKQLKVYRQFKMYNDPKYRASQ